MAAEEHDLTGALGRWRQTRSYHHAAFPPERLRAERRASIAVCLPTREVAGTIGPIVEALVALRELGVLDEVLVVDAASGDGTARVAARAGACVVQELDLFREWGPVRGKGDAMWRALSVLEADIVCFVDGDSEGFGPHFACGLIGPLVCDPTVQFVKAAYRRPFLLPNGELLPSGGGRVTELTARPLLNLFYPELAGFLQPLAGEFAARRSLLERLPWATGYAVEIALLIDAYHDAGLDALAQCDLELRQNRHQALEELAPMAYAVLAAVALRLRREGRLAAFELGPLLAPAGGKLRRRELDLLERPPLVSLPSTV